MLNRLVGNYLVKKGMMSQEVLDSMLPISKEMKAEVCTIAAINRVLTFSQIQEILNKTNRRGSVRFGDVAVEEGLLTDDRLEQILTYRSNSFMIFVQTMLNKGVITMGQINQLLDEFQMEEQYDPSQFQALLLDDVERIVDIFTPIPNQNMKMLTVRLIQTLKRLIDEDVYCGRPYYAESVKAEYYTSQTLTGGVQVKVYLCGSDKQLFGIANFFTDATYTEVNEEAMDNVAEFINCVNGQFVTDLSYQNVDVELHAPEIGMKGLTLTGGKLLAIPVHVNGCSLKVVYAM